LLKQKVNVITFQGLQLVFLGERLIFKQMKHITILLFTLGLALHVPTVQAHNGVDRKVEKNIAKVWPKHEISRKPMVFDTLMIDKYGLTEVHLFKLSNDSYIVGYLAISSAKGRFESFDYLMIFDSEMVIRRIDILVYRSSYGGEIASQSWLKQFYGKQDGVDMEFDKDIDTISGATISAPSMAKSVKSVSRLMVEVSTKKTGAQ